MKNLLFSITLFFAMAFITAPHTSSAQCAMCKAALESKSEEGRNVGIGINTGILYLMVVPYISFGVLAYMWYRNQKKKPVVRWKKGVYSSN
jgi:uncharacterized paraquat-inducible protein A